MSLTKFHVNPETGDVSRCRAYKQGCPFGESNHAFTQRGAEKIFEQNFLKEANIDNKDIFATITRKETKPKNKNKITEKASVIADRAFAEKHLFRIESEPVYKHLKDFHKQIKIPQPYKYSRKDYGDFYEKALSHLYDFRDERNNLERVLRGLPDDDSRKEITQRRLDRINEMMDYLTAKKPLPKHFPRRPNKIRMEEILYKSLQNRKNEIKNRSSIADKIAAKKHLSELTDPWKRPKIYKNLTDVHNSFKIHLSYKYKNKDKRYEEDFAKAISQKNAFNKELKRIERTIRATPVNNPHYETLKSVHFKVKETLDYLNGEIPLPDWYPNFDVKKYHKK